MYSRGDFWLTFVGCCSPQMLDVNFSFFDPQPQDDHSIKLLLSQLLGHVDAATGDLDLAGVTDLVLEQKLVGSTVKTDSGEEDDKANEGDPYAVLTVLNLNVHKVSFRVFSCVDSDSLPRTKLRWG